MKKAPKSAYVIGTFDTKARELDYVADLIKARGINTTTVDIGIKSKQNFADISARDVAAHHPVSASSVFVDDRGNAVTEMARALKALILTRDDIGGIIGLGGSGGTAMITPGMRALPIGIPKLMVSTLASGDVSEYVGPSDITMLHPVTDIAGLNRVSYKVLSNAAHAMAGMMTGPTPDIDTSRPAIGLSMFGVTTPCVLAITDMLETDFDCLVFHATGVGGQSLEKLIDQGDISGVLDITTTEICDLLVGGVLSAGEDRLGAVARTQIPFIGSCGALDMVNFWGIDSVPDKFKSRNLYRHNEQITLMRTTPAECAQIGAWIGNKLNACDGEVDFLLPLKGLSALDIENGPFHDKTANTALFSALEDTVKQTSKRRLHKLDLHINDPAFAKAAVSLFQNAIARQSSK
ncbi:Tm-1-like ATP-binding domain-containing protein [Candidatus Puniceispirillum marinum]|uniref:UPF0261 protein SAR116_1782 n=1 Tax=Puniceispirillum marinum (strain IMCC1322) TaxID=488538 RepID=D5BMI3_PUNMI|nr:Tm-1-like ATP-binding domain-containing protein [Candidatus Puniceispirillum marinum]ADE40026.1 hypothetical protein SAR116_1782 [Candidatus Puniceispirillum marinum IMCC1322]